MKKIGWSILLVSFFAPLAFGEKVFRYSEDGSPTNMDPVQGATVYANDIITAVYDTLYEYKYLKQPFELKPNLAEDFPKVEKDQLTYTFKIKKGVHFADDPCFKDGKGREVTAHDFVYSLKRHFDPANRSQGAWLWQGKIVGLDEWKEKGADYAKEVPGLKALDNYTIQIKLVKPYPQIVYSFAMGFSAVVPREGVEKYGREFSIKMVGSGPWIMKSHTPKKTVLVKNPKYRDETFDIYAHGYDEKTHGFSGIKALHGKKLPITDRTEINWIEDLNTRWNSFTKGSEIMWTVLQNEQMDEVLAGKNPVKLKDKYGAKYHFRVSVEAGLVHEDFNMDDDSFGYHKDPKQNARNKALRCALRKAWDWPQRIDRFYIGLGEAYPGVIPPGVDGYDPKMSRESVTLDIAGAKKILAENGWTPANLPIIEYSGTASVRQNQFFEQFRGWLEKIGYPRNKIKHKTYANFGDFNKAVKNRQAMMVSMAWALDYPDAENTLGLFYGPNSAPGSNSANYNNPEFNKLFDRASVMQPSPERTKLYQQLNQMIVDDCVSITGFSRTRVFLWHKDAIIWPQRDMIGNIYKYLDVKS